MSDFESVGEFHRKMGQPTAYRGRAPEITSNDIHNYRIGFLNEELTELEDAHRAGDIEGVADAIVDLVYVALGTAHYYGIPFDECFARVHEANMNKERANGSNGVSKRGEIEPVIKPPGWKAPVLSDVLEGQAAEVPAGVEFAKHLTVDGVHVLFYLERVPAHGVTLHQIAWLPEHGQFNIPVQALPERYALNMVQQIDPAHARKIVKMINRKLTNDEKAG